MIPIDELARASTYDFPPSVNTILLHSSYYNRLYTQVTSLITMNQATETGSTWTVPTNILRNVPRNRRLRPTTPSHGTQYISPTIVA